MKDEHVSEEAIADAVHQAPQGAARPRGRVPARPGGAAARCPSASRASTSACPSSIEGRVLVVAMVDPIDYQAIQDIEFASALDGEGRGRRRARRCWTASRSATAPRIASGRSSPTCPTCRTCRSSSEDRRTCRWTSATRGRRPRWRRSSRCATWSSTTPSRSGASDVHIEPTLHDVQVRMRVDGVLRDYTHVPKWLHGPLVSRLKILAKLDIAERRLPQDGRVNVQYQGRTIDIRVSTLPTHFGEKVVLRVLGGGVGAQRSTRWASTPTSRRMLEAADPAAAGHDPRDGPDGLRQDAPRSTRCWPSTTSPRSTSSRSRIRSSTSWPASTRCRSTRRPGLTFASVLRSILRQDPDVILVGEMRDQRDGRDRVPGGDDGPPGAEHAAHQQRRRRRSRACYDLDVDPSILATSLTLVIAQRLVRRICDECREEYEPEPRRSRNAWACSATDAGVPRPRAAPRAAARGSPGASASTSSSGRPPPSGS